MTPFNEEYPHGSGRAVFAPPPSDAGGVFVLLPGVHQTIEVPEGAAFVIFSATGDFWAAFGAWDVLAAVPSTSTPAEVSLNPAARRIPDGVTHIAVVAEAAVKGSIEFYS